MQVFRSLYIPPSILHFQLQTGGHEGTRTPNFLLVREAVYQLTYVPKPNIKGPYNVSARP